MLSIPQMLGNFGMLVIAATEELFALISGHFIAKSQVLPPGFVEEKFGGHGGQDGLHLIVVGLPQGVTSQHKFQVGLEGCGFIG